MSLCPLHISSIALLLLIIASCAETDDKTAKIQETTDNNMPQVTEIQPEPGT